MRLLFFKNVVKKTLQCCKIQLSNVSFHVCSAVHAKTFCVLMQNSSCSDNIHYIKKYYSLLYYWDLYHHLSLSWPFRVCHDRLKWLRRSPPASFEKFLLFRNVEMKMECLLLACSKQLLCFVFYRPGWSFVLEMYSDVE